MSWTIWHLQCCSNGCSGGCGRGCSGWGFVRVFDGEQIHCSQFPGSMVGQIFADQIEVSIRHHALEAGCFVVNSTGWLSDAQRAEITDDPKLQKALQGGCYSAIIAPDGSHLCDPITEGEGMAIADLDFSLITKRKRMLDSVGHYSRPDLFSLSVNKAAQPAIHSHEASTSTHSADYDSIEKLQSL